MTTTTKAKNASRRGPGRPPKTPYRLRRDREIGGRIREAREAAGLTQVELCKKLNAYNSRVSEYENGVVSIHDETLQALAAALDVTFQYLKTGDLQNNSEKTD